MKISIVDLEVFYRDAHFVLLNYTCRCAAKHPRVKLNEEGHEFRWVTPATAKKMPLNTPTRILLEAVLKNSRREGRRVAVPKQSGARVTRLSGRK